MRLATLVGAGAVLWLVLASACDGNTFLGDENLGTHDGGGGGLEDATAPTMAPTAGNSPAGQMPRSDGGDAPPDATGTMAIFDAAELTHIPPPTPEAATGDASLLVVVPTCTVNSAMPPPPPEPVFTATSAPDGKIYTMQQSSGDAGGMPGPFWVLDVPTATWSQLDGPYTSVGPTNAMAFLDSKVYLLTDKALEAYDVVAKTWTGLSLGANVNPAADLTGLAGALYAAGGNGGNTASRYDVAGNQWSYSSPAPFPWDNAALAAGTDGKIYALGAQGDAVYDPKNDRWSVVPDQITPRYSEAAAAVGSRIYTFGGYGGVSTADTVKGYEVEILDLATLMWSSGPRMPFVVGYQASAVLGCDGRFYVFGGRPGLQRLDPVSGRWDYSQATGPSTGGD